MVQGPHQLVTMTDTFVTNVFHVIAAFNREFVTNGNVTLTDCLFQGVQVRINFFAPCSWKDL